MTISSNKENNRLKKDIFWLKEAYGAIGYAKFICFFEYQN